MSAAVHTLSDAMAIVREAETCLVAIQIGDGPDRVFYDVPPTQILKAWTARFYHIHAVRLDIDETSRHVIIERLE